MERKVGGERRAEQERRAPARRCSRCRSAQSDGNTAGSRRRPRTRPKVVLRAQPLRHLVADPRGAVVQPHDGVVQRLPRLAVPHHRRLACTGTGGDGQAGGQRLGARRASRWRMHVQASGARRQGKQHHPPRPGRAPLRAAGLPLHAGCIAPQPAQPSPAQPAARRTLVGDADRHDAQRAVLLQGGLHAAAHRIPHAAPDGQRVLLHPPAPLGWAVVRQRCWGPLWSSRLGGLGGWTSGNATQHEAGRQAKAADAGARRQPQHAHPARG